MKIFIVYGTRPEAIKLLPVINKLSGHFNVKVVSTGQHLELLNCVVKRLKIEPDCEFGCMIDLPDLHRLSSCIQERMKEVIDIENPDLIMVQGDTLTAFATALTAYLRRKPLFHVEAGLRTGDKFSPFPEEMLRTLIARLADFHFAPTTRAEKNLLDEGVRKDRILVTGNTIVDALNMAVSLIDEKTVFEELSTYDDSIPKRIKGKKLVLLTLHRRENIGSPMRQVCLAIKALAAKYKNVAFLLPLHKNPSVRRIVWEQFRHAGENIVLTEALTYQSTLYLMKNSYIVMTDSGGIQEEAPSFGKPIIVLRNTTERPEILDAGIGFLAGTKQKNIIKHFTQLYKDKKFYEQVSKRKNPFGDGEASDRILKFLQSDEAQRFIKSYPESSQYRFVSENYKEITFTGG